MYEVEELHIVTTSTVRRAAVQAQAPLLGLIVDLLQQIDNKSE